MALTADGRALTQAHRRGQLAIAANTVLQARALWSQLDPSDIDGSLPMWLAGNSLAVQSGFQSSARLAETYVTEYRDAEGVAPGQIEVPNFDTGQNARILTIAGPVRVKQTIAAGVVVDEAIAKSFNKYSGIVRRQVMMGGRSLVSRTAGKDGRAIGWRRVTDGDPCAFCAMLASRGPAYFNEGTATRSSGSKLAYHGHCGCTAEIVYGEWQPTELEQRFINDYYMAAEEASEVDGVRSDKTVLWRMRRDGNYR